MTAQLSPSSRTTATRGRKRQVHDRSRLHDLLADALVAQMGFDAGGYPVVLPVAFAVDLDGPDPGGTLYLHGSVAAGWLAPATEREICVSVTELDGLVCARSGTHHSMNYRSAVVLGRARRVVAEDELRRALDLTVDHMVPGRSATLRPHTRKELAAVAVIALPLAEASMKERCGDPADDPEDIATGTWAGVVPVRRVLGAPVTSGDARGAPPADVSAIADSPQV